MANCSSLYILHPVDKIVDRTERSYWTAYALLSEFIKLKFGRWRKGGRTISRKYHLEWFNQQLEALGYSTEKAAIGCSQIINARFFVADYKKDCIREKWTVPKPWQYLFEPQEKHLHPPSNSEDDAPTLIYETTVEKALNRLSQTLGKTAESGDTDDSSIIKSLRELRERLSEYPPESLVILNCNAIISLVKWKEIEGGAPR